MCFFSWQEGVNWPFYLFQPLGLIPKHGSVISSVLDSIHMIARCRDNHYCPVPQSVRWSFLNPSFIRSVFRMAFIFLFFSKPYKASSPWNLQLNLPVWSSMSHVSASRTLNTERRKRTVLHNDKVQHFAEWSCKHNKTWNRILVESMQFVCALGSTQRSPRAV